MRKRTVALVMAGLVTHALPTLHQAQAQLFSDPSFGEAAANGDLDRARIDLDKGQNPNGSYNGHFITTAVIISSAPAYPAMITLFKEHGLDWKAKNPIKDPYAFGIDRALDQEEENLYFAARFRRTEVLKAAIEAGADPTSMVALLREAQMKSGDPAGARVILATIYKTIPSLAPVEAAKPPPDPSLMGVRLGMNVADAVKEARSHGFTTVTPIYVAQLNGRHGPLQRVDASGPTNGALGSLAMYISASTGNVMMISYSSRSSPATTLATCVEKWGQPATFDKDGKSEEPTWGDTDHTFVRCQGNNVMITDKDAQAASIAPAAQSAKPREKF